MAELAVPPDKQSEPSLYRSYALEAPAAQATRREVGSLEARGRSMKVWK